MKNTKLILIAFSFFALACVEENKKTPAPEPMSIGYGIYEADNKQRPIEIGAPENISIWETYIKAHNERDYETIQSMNGDNFVAYGPRGEVIKGKEEHIAFLKDWVAANDPKWKSNWFMTNAIKNPKGETRQWVTSGHEISLMVEGDTVNAVQIHDALIAEGKVQMFYVYERVKPQETE